jgi:hypothetical protein
MASPSSLAEMERQLEREYQSLVNDVGNLHTTRDEVIWCLRELRRHADRGPAAARSIVCKHVVATLQGGWIKCKTDDVLVHRAIIALFATLAYDQRDIVTKEHIMAKTHMYVQLPFCARAFVCVSRR